MRTNYLNIFFCGLVSIAMLSCVDGKRPSDNGADGDIEDTSSVTHTTSEKYLSSVFISENDKVFRNVNLDMALNLVKEAEDVSELNLTSETKNYLHFEQDLNIDTLKGVDYVEVKYIFDDQDRLDIITVNYYIQDSLVNNDVFNHLNESFNEKYGDYYIDSDGYTVWESSYQRADTLDVVYDIGIRKLVKLNDPGITIEMMRFGAM